MVNLTPPCFLHGTLHHQNQKKNKITIPLEPYTLTRWKKENENTFFTTTTWPYCD